MFSPTAIMVTVSVNILDDNYLELTERFTTNLTSSVPRLSLSPDEAAINIADNDCECSTVTP